LVKIREGPQRYGFLAFAPGTTYAHRLMRPGNRAPDMAGFAESRLRFPRQRACQHQREPLGEAVRFPLILLSEVRGRRSPKRGAVGENDDIAPHGIV